MKKIKKDNEDYLKFKRDFDWVDINERMQIVRELTSLGERLSQENKRPMRQPILDFGFGKVYHDKDNVKKLGCLFLGDNFIKVLAGALNIHDLGYDFSDNNCYSLTDIEPPKEKYWVTTHNDKYWISLYLYLPDWLAEIGKKRDEDRKEAARRKKEGLPYIYKK